MEKGYPILVILTNRSCSHCLKMRGRSGWPSDNLDSSSNVKWNDDFFIRCLTGIGNGDLDHYSKLDQKARVIELFYDKLTSDSKLIEATFFDLEPDTYDSKGLPVLVVKKYRPLNENDPKVFYQKRNKNGFIDSKELPKTNFDTFISKFIPTVSIRRYFHVFPNFIYVHSTIWEEAVTKDASLYARVQGFKTIRDGNDPSIYKILREKRADHEEKERSPAVVIKRLLDNKLEPLFFPIDHTS